MNTTEGDSSGGGQDHGDEKHNEMLWEATAVQGDPFNRCLSFVALQLQLGIHLEFTEEWTRQWGWSTHFNAILEGIRLKFKPHSYLQEKLLSTSPRPLAKVSTEDDPSWISLTMDNDDIDDLYEWEPNLLGIGLQIIRKELKDLSASTLRNYVQNLNSSTIDSESSRRIFELKSESEYPDP